MFKRIIHDLDSIFSRDPAARSRIELILCYPGVQAMFFFRISHWLWQNNLKLPGRLVSYLGRFITGIEIHPGATIGRRLFIDHGMGVVIGETARIGDDVTIYHDVTLGGTSLNHGMRHPQVGNKVIIGAGAQLLGPIQIGDNARIGSNAVVVADVQANTTVVGVPAHTVGDKEQRAKSQQFEPYATHDEHADPLLITIQRMHEELQILQRRVNELEADEVTLRGSAKRWDPE